MWIIPKSLHTSLSVQVTEGLTLDSGELSEMYAQSLLVRSKPSPVKTWSRRLKQGSLTLLPYGRTLRPSLGKAFETEWTSLVEASLVSHLAPQGDEQETATLATCGPSLPVDLDEWGTLPLFSWKTLKVSSAPNSKAQSGQTQRGRLFCSMSSENWKDWVIKRRREYSARARSAHPISESECSSWAVAPISVQRDEGSLMVCSESQSEGKSWATPRVGASKAPAGEGDPSKTDHKYRIENQVQKNWLTPATTAGDAQEPLYTATGEQWTGEGRAYRQNGMHRTLTLNMQVTHGPHQGAQSNTLGSPQELRLATPTSRDYKGMYPQWSQESENKLTRSLLPDQAHGGTYKGKLNPRWVETLMGLPVGWVMPSCANPWTIEQTNCACLEMGLSLQQQSEHSEYSGQNWPTHPASQRGDTVEIYERKSQKREAQGLARFAPTLQVAVLMEDRDE